ncbi:MAG: DNA repair protein RecO [Planctomycetes bacterium]|nr:DNA repair protein RecO [Planctomycetota bacterium]MCC7169342.1 DNA repair protein RecO [Planctomycetota bacterium]
MKPSRLARDAIVLRRAPFSETSQVVDLLTPDDGRLSVLARGSYRDKSTFGGPLDVLTRGVADVQRRKRSELDLLHGFKITQPWRGLRRELTTWLAASHALELVRAFAWPRDREPALFDALAGVLELLDRARERYEIEAYLTSFAGRVLAIAGFVPVLDACVRCGGDVADAKRGWLSLAQGGLLCGSCSTPDRTAIVCSDGVVRLLRRALGGAPDATPGTAWTETVVSEARRAIDLYVEYRLERPLLSRRLLDRAERSPSREPVA